MLDGLGLFAQLVAPRWRALLLATALMAAAAGFQAAVPFALGALIGALGDPAVPARGPLLLFGVLSFGAFFWLHASAYHSRFFVPRLRMFVQERLLAEVLGRPPLFFRITLGGAIGEAIKQCGRCAVLIAQTLTEDTVRLAVAFAVALVLLALEGLWGIALGLTAWAAVFFALATLFAQSARPAVRAFSKASREAVGEIVDTLSNYDAVRTANTFAGERARVGGIMAEERDRNIESRGRLLMMSFIHGGASWLLILGLGAYCALAVPDRLSLGQAATVVTLSIVLSNLSQSFSRTLMDFFETLERFREAHASLGEAVPRGAPAARPAVPHGRAGPDAPAIRVSGIDVRYPGVAEPVLKGVTFEVLQGGFVGVVGGSGVGKSTLLQALLDVLPLEAGEIRLFDRPLARIDAGALSALVSYVPQVPHLFARSLRENLAYEAAGASDEAVWAALEAAASAEIARGRPEGLDFRVGVEGRRLSVGERQRIVVARAILADKPILLLDEPTSALDGVASEAVARAVEALRMRGSTVVYVTHQLSNTVGADAILVLEDGRIVQQGPHRTLVDAPGPYRAMWRRREEEDAQAAVIPLPRTRSGG